MAELESTSRRSRVQLAAGAAVVGSILAAATGLVRRRRAPIVTAERARAATLRRKQRRRARRDLERRVGAVTRRLGVHEQAKRLAGLPDGRAVRVAKSAGTAPIDELVARLRTARGPVVFGPWFGEVGYEVLYWVPFLRWLRHEHDLDPSQWHVVSRGGTRHWYGDVASGGYADALSVVSPEEFRILNEARWLEVGSQKQRYESEAEVRLLESLQRAGALPGAFEHVHPSEMYEYFWLAWKGRLPGNLVWSSTRYERVAAPPPPDGLDLPDRFVACKWYVRPSLTDAPANVDRIRRLTRSLAARGPVVLLHDNPQLDDHPELDLSGISGVTTVLTGVAPERNLEVQSAVIARADAFYGTYGGIGYVPMLYGVPSVLFASEMAPLNAVHVKAGLDAAALLGARHSLLDLASLDRFADGVPPLDQGSSTSAG